jgi:hypothetical protein
LNRCEIGETEEAVVNVFGDKMQVIRPPKNWRCEFDKYQQEYAQAEDKVAFNAGYVEGGK